MTRAREGDREFVARRRIEAPREALFAYHQAPGALERLTPPWERFRVVERSGGIEDGARMVAKVGVLGPLRVTWEAVHRDFVPGVQFRDEQVRGPFASWVHTHRMEGDDGQSVLEDRVEYRLPLGPFGAAGAPMVRSKLERMFRYRHEVTVADVERHHGVAKGRTLKIAITGASGLLGTSLTRFLRTGGHEVVPLVRSREAEGIYWKPSEGEIDAASLEGHDAVIHLAGESLFGRWTDARKARIVDSREKGTQLLARTLGGLTRKPEVLVSASGAHYYGDTGAERVDESAPAGDGFLPEVCRRWEQAAAPAAEAGIRVVHPRISMVLTPEGGALGQMLTPFKMAVGGRLGRGDQYMSWISGDDLIGALYFAVFEPTLSGPVNVSSPNPVTNAEFTRVLGQVLGRPTPFPVPGFALKTVFGSQMAEEMLLHGPRVWPRRLEEAGFEWRHPDLESALRHLLGK